MKNWEITKVGKVCKFEGGSQPPKSLFSFEAKADYIRLLQIRDYKSDKHIVYIPQEKAKRFCNEDDIMIGRYGPPVFQILRGLNGAYNVALMKAIPNEKVLSKDYAFLFLKYSKIQDYIIHLSQRAAGQTGVNKEAIEDYPILLPPLPEQQRIVSILDGAFAVIAVAKQNAEKNLQNAKELFETYLQSVFENKGEDWEEKSLKEVCEFKPQKKEARDKLKESDLVTFLPMEDLGVLNKDIVGVKERQLKDVSGSYTYFAENDVLLAKITPCFENGKLGVARNLINGVGFGSSEYIVFRSKGRILPDYLYYFLSRKQIREEGKKLMTGAVGHKRVSKDWIEAYILPFPKSFDEQQIIVNKLNALSVETEKLEALYKQKLSNLEELKKTILQKAFKGELNVTPVPVL